MNKEEKDWEKEHHADYVQTSRTTYLLEQEARLCCQAGLCKSVGQGGSACAPMDPPPERAENRGAGEYHTVYISVLPLAGHVFCSPALPVYIVLSSLSLISHTSICLIRGRCLKLT